MTFALCERGHSVHCAISLNALFSMSIADFNNFFIFSSIDWLGSLKFYILSIGHRPYKMNIYEYVRTVFITVPVFWASCREGSSLVLHNIHNQWQRSTGAARQQHKHSQEEHRKGTFWKGFTHKTVRNRLRPVYIDVKLRNWIDANVRDSATSAPCLGHYSYLNKSNNGWHLFPAATI